MKPAALNAAPSPKVRWLEVEDNFVGQRIDNFLVSHLKGVPRSAIYRILRRGEVRVNSGRVQQTYRLQKGDRLRIPPVTVAEATQAPPPSQENLEKLKECLLYEDNHFFILNKPEGWASHGGSGIRYGIIEALRVLYPHAKEWELAHRLDRDTSGCLVIAKRRSALHIFHEQLREGKVQKHYFALLAGSHRSDWESTAPLKKQVLQGGERMVVVNSKEGKPSHTRFFPVTTYANATLFRVELETGRTHQIRVHAAHAGSSVAGDEKYGDKIFNQKMRHFGLKRLFLHAHSLAFRLNNEVSEFVVEAPLPTALAETLSNLSYQSTL